MRNEVEERASGRFARRAYRDRNSVCHLVFKDLLREEVMCLDSGSTVLDIGCGSGIGRESTTQQWVASQVKALWGVEPDVEVEVPSCFANVWRSNFEDASIAPASVDFAYAFMVLEHVEKSDAFLDKLFECLKPGGVFLAATINAKGFFARVARLSASVGLQKQVLAIARPQALKDYHYPAVYKLNTRAYWTQAKEKYGFSKCETLVVDSDEWFPYFPKKIRWSAHIVRAVFQRSEDTYPYMFLRLKK